MNLMRIACSLALLTLVAARTAASQNIGDDGGTLDVASMPVMSNGKLTGCQLTFNAIIRDYTYRQGAFLGVSGGVGLMNTQQKLGATVKIVTTSLDQSGKLAPSPPSRAYLIGANYATNLDSLVIAAASDQPGGLFSIYQVEPTIGILLDALKSKKLVFAFNQNGGGTDIQLPIELDIASTDTNGVQVRSDKTTQDFAACVLTLMKE